MRALNLGIMGDPGLQGYRPDTIHTLQGKFVRPCVGDPQTSEGFQWLDACLLRQTLSSRTATVEMRQTRKIMKNLTDNAHRKVLQHTPPQLPSASLNVQCGQGWPYSSLHAPHTTGMEARTESAPRPISKASDAEHIRSVAAAWDYKPYNPKNPKTPKTSWNPTT